MKSWPPQTLSRKGHAAAPGTASMTSVKDQRLSGPRSGGGLQRPQPLEVFKKAPL